MRNLLDLLSYSALERKLNSVKSSCLTVEAAELADACDEIFLSIQKHDANKTRKGIDSLESLFVQLEEELSKMLADRSTYTLPGAPKAP